MKPPSITAVSSAAASPKPSTLEKVARAIYELGEKDSGGDHGSWDHIPDEPRSFCFALARAALVSLRQVDDETIQAAFSDGEDPGYREDWNTLLDHILTEGGEG